MTSSNHNETNDLAITRVIDVPRERVWEAWTNPEVLKQWFCPRPWRVTDCTIELHPGGRFHTTMAGPDGEVMPNPGVILEVVPFERLVTTDAYTEAWKPAEKPFMTAIVEFEDLGGKTRYTATARHWNVEDRIAHEKMGFYDGWNTALDQLIELVTSASWPSEDAG